MNYSYYYYTPEGFSDLMMKSDGRYLTGLWFVGSPDERKHMEESQVQVTSGAEDGERQAHEITCTENEKSQALLPVFQDTVRWLDIYFSGEEPDFLPEYKVTSASDFRMEVSHLMEEIPYGKTVTYGDIARTIAARRGIARMSAQAVGGAVGANPIGIIIPCHRVMGAGGTLTGYGGGLENKVALLRLEGVLE